MDPRPLPALLRVRAAAAWSCIAMLSVLLTSCNHAPTATPLPAWHDARQMVLVTSSGWDATEGQLRRFERGSPDDAWRETGISTPVMLGRSGTAWGTGLHPAQHTGPQKREGDGRAPAGAFAIGVAFGYGDDARTMLDYQAMDASDWCIDVNASPLYNRIVSSRDVGEAAIDGSTEPMRRDLHVDGDIRYRLGFVIEHNPRNTPGGGSCIFAHLWQQPGETTAGCTAMDEPAMRELLAWLDPARKPVFVLLPETEHARLAIPWALPPR